ncbi:MAG: hypothetical protein PHE40_09565, partial [Acidocella sp.]|nr:hypothetical protein [Acidocella sp.]
MEGRPFAAEMEAVRRDRRNLPALRAQAEALFAGGQREEAVALLRAADALAPDDFFILRILSGFLAGMGQMEEATQLAARAVGLAPEAAEARLHLASLYLARQQYGAAV